MDHGLAFPQNKQNEPSITRDPVTGVLIAGANDEIGQPLCPGTSTPLASPCPFAPGVPTSAYYYSADNRKTWTGGYLPGFGRRHNGVRGCDEVLRWALMPRLGGITARRPATRRSQPGCVPGRLSPHGWGNGV
jgi:hypothetical protein